MAHLRRLAPLLVGLLLLVPACGDKAPEANTANGDGDGPTRLVFSAIPGEKATKMREKFSAFGDWLSKELGIPVEYRHAASYKASVHMFAKGEIQLAWFGGLTGCQARARVKGAAAIAQGVEDPEYYSYFIAHKDAGVEPSDSPDKFPEGLAGKTFTWGSNSSTSGRLMPEFFLKKHTGKTPSEYFAGRPLVSGSHPKTAESVQSGAVQAGSLSYRTYDKMVKDGEIDPAVCVKVWQTPHYADYNFTAHPSLGTAFIERLQAAILKYADKDVLENGFQRTGFIKAQNSDFARIRETAIAAGFDLASAE